MANAGSDPIANLGFEDAGAYAGSAQWWSLRSNARWLSFAFTDREQPAEIEVDPTIDLWSAWNSVVTVDDIESPNGGVTGAKLEDDGTNGLHEVSYSIDVVDGEEYVFAAWLRAGDLPYAGFRVGTGGDFVEVIFDLRIGEVTAYTEGATGFESSSYRVVAGRGPWKLYMIAFKPDADATLSASINLSVNGLQFGYSGSGEFVYVWQPRVVQGSLRSVEAMDSWVTDYATSIGISNSLDAFFETDSTLDDPFDSFEVGWGASFYQVFVWDAFIALFDSGVNAFESMSSWYTFNGTFSGTGAVFDGGAWELFAWPAEYYLAWGPPDFIEDEALFDDGVGSEYYEDFEEYQADVYASSNATANTLNATAHGLLDGTIVRVVANPGSPLPGGLMATLDYEVTSAVPDAFQLSLDGGVTAVDITTDNIVCIVRGDPATKWTGAEAF